MSKHRSDSSDDLSLTQLFNDASADAILEGKAFYTLEKYDQALEAFSAAITFNPSNHEAYSERGLTHYSLSNHDQALADIKEAIRLDPANPLYYENKRLLHEARGEHHEALDATRKALALDADNAEYQQHHTRLSDSHHAYVALLQEELQTRDAAEQLAIVRDRSAGSLGKLLQYTDSRLSAMILALPTAKHIEARHLGGALKRADPDKTRHLLAHPNSAEIKEKYLTIALDYTKDAESITALQNHLNTHQQAPSAPAPQAATTDKKIWIKKVAPAAALPSDKSSWRKKIIPSAENANHR